MFRAILASGCVCACAAAAFTVPLPKRCDALHGKSTPWRITVVEQAPLVVVREADGTPIRDPSQWTGFSIDMIKQIASICHVRYTLQLPGQLGALADYSFGTSGSYGHGQRDVWANASDIYFAGYYGTKGRMDAGLMTSSVMHMPLTLVTRASQKAPNWSAFLEPFAASVWCGWLAAAFFAGTVFWVLEAGNAGTDFHQNQGFQWSSFKANISHSVWLAWSTTTGTNAHSPITLLGKLFSGVWGLFCIVLLASYTASLAAHLVQANADTEVSSFEHLKSEGKMLCVQKNTAYANSLALEGAMKPLLLQLDSVPDMLQALMVKKTCAAMMHTSAAMLYSVHTACKVSTQFSMVAIGTLNYLDQDMCVGLHKAHTAARDELSYHITSLRHSGVIDALEKSYLIAQSSAGCNAASGTKSKQFTLEWVHLKGLFLALATVAGICSLMRWLVTWNEHRGDSGTLAKFVQSHFPPDQFSVESIIGYWKSDWEVRFLMRPLVAKYLAQDSIEEARLWTERGLRIQDIDKASGAGSADKLSTTLGEALERHTLEHAFDKYLHPGVASVQGITRSLETKLKVKAQRAKYNLAVRRTVRYDQHTAGGKLGSADELSSCDSFMKMFEAQADVLRACLSKVRSTLLHAKLRHAKTVVTNDVSMSAAKSSFKARKRQMVVVPAAQDDVPIDGNWGIRR